MIVPVFFIGSKELKRRASKSRALQREQKDFKKCPWSLHAGRRARVPDA